MPEDHNRISWEEWDKKVTDKMAKWNHYTKYQIPPNQDVVFKNGSFDLSQLMLEETNLQRYLTILVFLKEHPSINMEMFRWACRASDLQGSFTSRILLSPLEVIMKFFLYKTLKKYLTNRRSAVESFSLKTELDRTMRILGFYTWTMPGTTP